MWRALSPPPPPPPPPPPSPRPLRARPHQLALTAHAHVLWCWCWQMCHAWMGKVCDGGATDQPYIKNKVSQVYVYIFVNQ